MDPECAANGVSITAEVTRVGMGAVPAEPQGDMMVLTVSLKETHQWVLIGSATRKKYRNPMLHRRRRISVLIPDCLLNNSAIAFHRNDRHCRDLIGETLECFSEVLTAGQGVSLAHWCSAVPDDLVQHIRWRAERIPVHLNVSCKVRLHVTVHFVYSEPMALLLGCISHSSVVAAAASQQCAICLDNMVQGADVLYLPSCRHGFHMQCILRWFEWGTICPMCRGQCRQFLPAPYMHQHP
ncbi:unnamed protein product [Urochloa decumbens]|uniref:RING-type domain-containing protein n=1 Tax=Urochloa decumbens TaxID=240449 RepID=A0ABC9B7U2_9POAL